MFKRILVALDGSPFSEQMLGHAQSLATSLGVPIELVRVIEGLSQQERAEEWIGRVADVWGCPGTAVWAEKDVAQTLLNQAKTQPQTLLALTSHGHSGALEALFGNVAMQVVRINTQTPTLVYHPKGRVGKAVVPERVQSIVLPLDGSSASETIAPDAAQLARALDVPVLVVNVVNPSALAAIGGEVGLESGYVRTRAEELGRDWGCKTSWEVLHGDPATAISEYVRQQPASILAMTTRAQSALKTVFLGSVTQACLRQAGVPLLLREPG